MVLKRFLPVIAHGRGMEWVTSTFLMAIALALALPGNSLQDPIFQLYELYGITEATVSTPIAIIATTGILALVVNGHFGPSPAIRAACAIARSFFTMLLGTTFLWPTIMFGMTAHPVAPIALVCFTMSFWDLVAGYRVGADMRIIREKFREARRDIS
jgi:hypothetical protein